MALFQGLLFLFFGVGLLVMVWQSLERGWLPCGANGFKGRIECRRDDRPGLFWLLFVCYLLASLVLTAYAMGLLTGVAAPLPLR